MILLNNKGMRRLGKYTLLKSEGEDPIAQENDDGVWYIHTCKI